ncbi:Uncharacterized protein OS=Cyanothece sp. (strain PCC 7425 / ATCC 29141) GN=Cyan7425_3221 PE=4 SV=1 [Gemmataceae bacterium]|nr:Uncharacterized protein OS=Cyanothece sp. (strain PCC 7425 / ATCC 29141) GN=Cyan7425_3221 PE=4 SV=1 [Gemmataceae bacterium]VTU00339.1 Uncharacterized protein OS=Cyanothece sp. (strain PCC 7425 / ATCC 29141) GN=Cyan7425_3221 PE=4 SV=1 [Gemmataceae bacterium]
MTTATEPRPTDAALGTTQFGSHLLQLVGEPFLFLRRSYGDELVLHFGERLLGPVRRTKHGEFRYEHGTHSLHLRGSFWVVKAGDAVFAATTADEVVKSLGEPSRRGDVVTEASITVGARVTAVIPFPVDRAAVQGIGVKVDLSDGSSVVVIPTPDEPPESLPEGTTVDETADWELHTPRGALQIGPGRKWHFDPRPRG